MTPDYFYKFFIPGNFRQIARVLRNLLLLIFASCGFLEAENKIPVYVSILPQQYFVQQIGKNAVVVKVMVPPGANPATYEPAPAQMTALAKTSIYFSVGVPFESAWLDKIAAINSGMRIVHTDDRINKHFMENHICDEAAHPSSEKHDHKAPGLSEHISDPHIWLSPPLVKKQAETIFRALQQADPERSAFYEQNHQDFVSRIEDLDNQFKKMFADIRTTRFMVFHPAWGYFAHAYGLTQIPVEIEGKSPKPAQLKKIIDYARQYDLNFILVQPQFSAKTAGQVARAINGGIIYADPLAYDWEKNLFETATKISLALK